MNSVAALPREEVVDIADELREEPGLSVLYVSCRMPRNRMQNVLLVRARDIALFSSQSVPSIQVLGDPGDVVQLADTGEDEPGNTWQRYPRNPDFPGFTLYSSEHEGKLVQLLVEDGLKVVDAGGERV